MRLVSILLAFIGCGLVFATDVNTTSSPTTSPVTTTPPPTTTPPQSGNSTTNPVSGSDANTECSLPCRNGGECRPGRGHFAFAGVLEDDEGDIPFIEQAHQTQHCACSAGWTGIYCEIRYITCGDHQHTCFNGAECKEERDGFGNLFYHCECDAAHSDLSHSYAGKYCQHASSVFCGTGDSSFGSSDSYCVNGGVCKEPEFEGQVNVGCDCPPTWEGRHCEIPFAVNGAPLDESKDDLLTSDEFVISTSVIGAAGLCLLAALIVYWFFFRGDKPRKGRAGKAGFYRKKKSKKNRNQVPTVVHRHNDAEFV